MRRFSRLHALLVASLVLILAAPASAWSYKEHMLFTRLAVQRILADEAAPQGLKDFLNKAMPNAGTTEDARAMLVDTWIGPRKDQAEGLLQWSIRPDFDRREPVPQFNTVEAPMHFVDLEFFNRDPARQVYRDDLSNKPSLNDIPRDPTDERLKQAGFLPFRVEQCYNDLVRSFREDNLMPAGEDDVDNALVWAGYLAHYLQDNTQPHHSTIDYRSASYFGGTGRTPNIHGMMEYGFLDDEELAYPELRKAYWRELQTNLDNLPPAGGDVTFGDPYESTLRISLSAYDALPLIGRAAMAATGQGGTPAEPEGRPANPSGDLETFANFRGDPGPGIRRLQVQLGREIGEVSILELKAMLGAAAVFRTELAIRQAWQDAQDGTDRMAAPATLPATRPTSEPTRRRSD